MVPDVDDRTHRDAAEGAEFQSLLGATTDDVGQEYHAEEEEASEPSEAMYWYGVFLVVLVALLWVLTSFIVQGVEASFNHPFLITYTSNALFVVYLPLAYYRFIKRKNTEAEHTLLSVHETARAAAIICPVWFMANFLYNVGLCQTSVTSSTILSSTSSFFTLGIGAILGLEYFDRFKGIGVSGTILGNVMVAYSDSLSIEQANISEIVDNARLLSEDTCHTTGQQGFGDAVTLLGAIFYAMYTLLFKQLLPGDESVDMTLLFGFIGLATTIGLLPILIFVVSNGNGLAGLTASVFGFIVLNSFLSNILSDYLWARAVLLTTPTVASVGLSLTIPLSMIIEYLIDGAPPPLLQAAGAVCVCIGFFSVNWSHVDGNGIDTEDEHETIE